MLGCYGFGLLDVITGSWCFPLIATAPPDKAGDYGTCVGAYKAECWSLAEGLWFAYVGLLSEALQWICFRSLGWFPHPVLVEGKVVGCLCRGNWGNVHHG